jgi:hypothetical protein
MTSQYLKYIITILSLITLNNWLISQSTFLIGDKFHKSHSEKHIFEYRFYIDKADEIQLHFLSEIITHFNLPKTISKEVSYSGINESQREIITSISYKNIFISCVISFSLYEFIIKSTYY